MARYWRVQPWSQRNIWHGVDEMAMVLYAMLECQSANSVVAAPKATPTLVQRSVLRFRKIFLKN